MILFTRTEAREFELLTGKCVSGRPRGPASPVVVTFAGGVRTLSTTPVGGAQLTHTSSAPGEPDDVIVLPASVLTEAAGGTDEAVTLSRKSRLRGTVEWLGGGKPRSLPVELILPGKQHDLPRLPPLSPVPASFLSALHECGKSVAKDSGRFALSMVQIQGAAGRVVGTDSHVALIWRGFSLPFQENLLVPALAVFGTKPLSRAEAFSVGRTSSHLVVSAGPWCVWVPVETKARYPDVASVVPLQSPALVHIGEPDVTPLMKALPGLPGADHEDRPVTLDVDQGVTVRGRDPSSGEVRQFHLPASRAEGTPIRVVVDRRSLARALSLGCRVVRLTPERPAIFIGGDVTLVAVALDPALAAPPPDAIPSRSLSRPDTPQPPNRDSEPATPQERRTEMSAKPPETNGHAQPRGDPTDPLADAEDLRAVLADALTRTTKLIAALRAGEREKKALANVFAGLKQLNLENGGST